jgi:hypothetical protein
MIVTMADEHHLVWLRYSMLSLAHTNPNVPVFVMLLNCPHSVTRQVISWHEDVQVGMWFGKLWRCRIHDFVSHLKPVAIRMAMRRNRLGPRDHVLWIDSDCIYLGDISSFTNMMDKYDFVIKTRKDKSGDKVPDRIRFQAGVFGLRLSSNGLALLDKWETLINKEYKNQELWCAKQHDQGRLFLAYKALAPRIRKGNLPHAFNLQGIGHNPIIWHLIGQKDPKVRDLVINKIDAVFRERGIYGT